MVVQVQGTADDIEHELRTLRAALEALAPQWRTDAALALQQSRDIWDDDATQLRSSLAQISEGLDRLADCYRDQVRGPAA